MTGARGVLRRGTLLVAVAALTAAGIATSTTSSVAAKPTGKGDIAKARFFSFNDFHGALDAPSGSGGLVNGVPAGGAEYLTTLLKKLRADADAQGQKTLTVGAGDMVGATPLLSAAFHDEPTIETLNLLRMDVTSVGNHEFDEGVDELLRLQNGGCHPIDGCQDGDPFLGADFPYLAANTVYKDTGNTILPAYTTRAVQGVKVGFIGMTLEGTPGIVNPAGIAEVDFLDEIVTANDYADQLLAQGVQAIVVLLHEGGQQNPPVGTPANPSGCAGFSGPLVDIVAGLDPEIDLVVSGHSHRPYICNFPNSAGQPVLATSANSNGTIVTDITATLSKTGRDFTSLSATNVIVENGVKNADGTWQIGAGGVPVRNPATVDAETKLLLDKYRTAVAPIANRIIGSITANISRTNNPAGESPLGDVIADAQLAYTQSAGAQLALMNPGGIRADLTYAFSPGGEPPGDVTYGEAFTVQPFNNLVTTQTFTGAQLKAVLEQQFPGAHRGSTVILQPSSGFTYSYDTTRAAGDKVSDIMLNGVPIDPAASYRVTTNDFLANGGDSFPSLTVGTNRVYAPGFDIDALAAYLAANAPVAPGPANRIVKIA